MSYTELIFIIVSSVGTLCVLLCIAYTMHSIIGRLDAQKEQDAKRLADYDATVPDLYHQLEMLNTQNMRLRNEIAMVRADLNKYRRHPAFVMAEQELKRRRRATHDVKQEQATDNVTELAPFHNTTPSSSEGGDDV